MQKIAAHLLKLDKFEVKEKHPAQILVITLLVLVILSIIIVGAVNLSIRDVQQTVANREYQRLYSAAENKIIELVDQLAEYSETDLNTLISPSSPSTLRNISTNCVDEVEGGKKCTFIEDDLTTEVVIRDKTNLDDFKLAKDESLTLRLNGYIGVINFRINPGSALKFTLLYTDTSTGQLVSTTDVFDVHGVYNSNGGDPFSDPGNNHILHFVEPTSGDPDLYRIHLWRTARFSPLQDIPHTLTVTARRQTEDVALIDLWGSGAGFPAQIREITSVSYRPQSDTNIVARAITEIPITPQPLPIFNYVLYSGDPISKF